MLSAVLVLSVMVAGQGQPVPQPFPRPGSSQPATQAPPSTPAQSGQPRQVNPPVQPAPPAVQPATPTASTAAVAEPVAPTEAQLGVPIYPGAQFLRSYDAGRGQRYYLFGSAAPFVDLVTYYRTVLKQKGELIYDVPATHEFNVGKFNEDTMAFPPGVTIKDFQSDVSQGFPNPKAGAQPARFPTVIQIVPAAPTK